MKGNVILFTDDALRYCVFRFVSDYRAGRWFIREKIGYSLSPDDAKFFYDEDEIKKAVRRISRDYPASSVSVMTAEEALEMINQNRFWVIARVGDGVSEDYYDGTDTSRKPTYTTDTQRIRLMLSERVAEETLRTIQQCTRDRVYVKQVYANIINELLSPVLMIICTRKLTGETKYFARLEGNRLRTVKTSSAAMIMEYDKAMMMYIYLSQNNRSFNYAVLPKFRDNVRCSDIEAYMRNNKISRMIAVDVQLTHLNRSRRKQQ